MPYADPYTLLTSPQVVSDADRAERRALQRLRRWRALACAVGEAARRDGFVARLDAALSRHAR